MNDVVISAFWQALAGFALKQVRNFLLNKKNSTVIREVGIILILTSAVGFTLGLAGWDLNSALLPIGFFNMIFIPIAFAISGANAIGNRWAHLFKVALVLWVSGLINVLFGIATFELWVLSFVPILVMMGLGGVGSYAFNRG